MVAANGLSFLGDGGEMGKLIRAKDWSKTSIGSPETWPQSLRTTVSLCLASNFPINIVWGPDAVQIYNDGYRDCCGDAHPRALGEDYRVTWASAWPAIGESFERARAGATMYLENRPMFLRRLHGGLEETFFTFSHSPIRDESGGIGGLFHPVTETTATMLAERRTRALRDLAARLATAVDADGVARETVEILSGFPFDLPFLVYFAFDPVAGAYRLAACNGIAPGAVAPSVQADATEPWPVAAAERARQPVPVEDLRAALRGAPCGPYEEPPVHAFVLPVVVPGAERLPALLVAGVSPRLRLDADYRSFYDLLGVTISGALATVRAREDERRRAEALAEIDRAKTLFFSNVSHEFRTPLTLMLGPLEETLARGAVDGVDRDRLLVAHRNGLRLLRLVNSLLDFSRVEAGRVQASYRPADLAALTADLASNFRSACERAGLRLVVDCPPLPQPVHVDRDMWEKIVLNLVSNAFKFTFEGEIAISVRVRDGMAELVVRDTGTGIPEAELPRIFERFHRVENASGRTHEGTGIGLALVQELVRLHGGTVTVASIVGAGAIFTVRVPFGTAHLPADRIDADLVSPATATRAEAFVEEALRWLPGSAVADIIDPARDMPVAAPAGSNRPLVLLADDNADMRDYMRRILAPRYEVEAAANGEAALAAAEARTPDLLLADVMMPRLDGFGLLRAVRTSPALTGLPVVLLSARAGEEARVEGLQAGADDYLGKPFSARELLARVGANLDLARMRRRASEAVHESEARYRALVTAGSYMIYRMSPDWRQMYQLDGRELLADTPEPIENWADEYILPEDRPAVFAAIAEAIRSGSLFELEHRVRRADGSVGWVLSRAVPIRGPEKEIVEWFGAGTDVTERHVARERLALSEERFRSFAENSADVLWIMNKTGTQLEYLSPAFGRTFGEGRHAVLADLSRWTKLVHPEDREQAAPFLPRAVAGEVALAHYRVVRPSDGRVVHLRDTGFPIRDASGAITRVAGIAQDVTDMVRAGEALEAEKERFRTLAEGIPQLVWRSGEDGGWTWASPQWRDYTGQSQAESHGGGWLDAVHPDDREATMRAWQAARPHGRLDVEFRVRRDGDGAWRWHATRSVPVRDTPKPDGTEGRILEWLGTTTDIEDLKRLQGQQQVLVAELQHRTRNLLAVVRNVARRSIDLSPGRDDYDGRLAALGRVQGFLSRSPAYLVALADLVEAELRALGDGASERVTAAGPSVELPGESVQTVALALHELATNALKYGAVAQPSGRLAVTWRIESDDGGGRLVIDWQESGVTMPNGGGTPARRGYGSELITKALPYQLEAETALEFTPDGVRCRIALPAGSFSISIGDLRA